MYKRNPGVSAVLSFIIPGLGQIYNGELSKGFGYVFGVVISCILFAIFIGYILYLILWVSAIVDAYRMAELYDSRVNSEE